MRFIAVLQILMASMLLGACASRVAQQLPESVLDSAVLARNVAGAEQGFEALEPGDVFPPDVPEILAWARVRNVHKVSAMRWLWYSPDGVLYYDSGEIVIQPTGAYHPHVTAWQSLPILHWRASWLPGEWRVVIQLNQSELVSLRFKIQPWPEHVVGNREKKS